MHLLGWYQLGARESTAAIRFPKAVRVSSMRIFPKGTCPFSQASGIVAQTEPEAFFLDVFFNIQPSSKLAPTRIAYAGGQTEFAVDMSPEHSTKLIIFHGGFQSLFVAIYGDLAVTEAIEIDRVYEEKTHPAFAYIPLSTSVDPGNSSKPTSLAEQLLGLLNEPPTLSVATRLIFSLKPEKDDWDHPDFPYLYSELEAPEESNLQDLVQSAERPIRDNIPSELLTDFATAVHDALKSKQKSADDAYYVAKLLSMTASQQTQFSKSLLEHLNLAQIFNEYTLDEETVHWLRDAAANIEIARYFTEDNAFLLSLEDMSTSPKIEKSVQKALKKLLTRLHGWQCFEDALVNPDGDFVTAASFLKEISTIEHSLGCWLECMITHENLVSKLGQSPGPEPRGPPPLLFQTRPAKVSHDDFIVFVKALLGISSVLVALAWADSMGNVQCRERALALLVLWQGADGYREIVNHCLLIRQITQRLGWNKSDDIPRGFGILAERLLVGLAKDPQVVLSDDLVTTVLGLEPPFSFIAQEELMEMRKIANVARDGLWSAIEELAYEGARPFSLRRLRVLRASLAIVVEELSYDKGEWRVLESFWTEKNRGMLATMISVLVDISDDLNHHFAVKPPHRMNQALADLLLHTADDVLHMISHFTLTYPLASRELLPLVKAISDLYACSSIASSAFSKHLPAHLAAQNIRSTCPEILRNLIAPNYVEYAVPKPHIVLKALLEIPTQTTIRDPVLRLAEIYDLIDRIIPQYPTAEESTYWTTGAFTKVLPELSNFCKLLEPKVKVAFVERLVNLDNGETGLGEWLVIEEMKELTPLLYRISNSAPQDEYSSILRYQLSAEIRFCHELLISPTASEWALAAFVNNEEISQLLDTCLSVVLSLDLNISSLSFTRLLKILATHKHELNPDIQFSILLLLMRNAQANPTRTDSLDFVVDILRHLAITGISIEPLRNEVGRTLSAYSDHASTITKGDAETLLQILEWLAFQEDAKLKTMAGLSFEGFNYLCITLSSVLPPSRRVDLTSAKEKLSMDEDHIFPLSEIELPDNLILPLASVEGLLLPPPFEPSTPKSGNKTPDILGVVISPPTALLRSPAATGLTKTYANNDFRQLRASSSTRLNTSRLPSTHVDEFEHLSQSPELLAAAIIVDTSMGQANTMFPGFL